MAVQFNPHYHTFSEFYSCGTFGDASIYEYTKIIVLHYGAPKASENCD